MNTLEIEIPKGLKPKYKPKLCVEGKEIYIKLRLALGNKETLNPKLKRRIDYEYKCIRHSGNC